MSPKQWLALLCFYISYLFLGASIFYYIEHRTELENRAAQLKERISINELLVKNAAPEDKQIQDKILKTLSEYCGRPVTNYTLDEYPVDYEWSFYHSFWFSFIVCSTVGYGNSSPHDQPGQAFLIFYALIGLPVNGFVLAYLGNFFSETCTGIYHRYYKGHEYSENNVHDATKRLGMVRTIAIFLVPGIAFFIFLPACLFTYFENWPYVTSVYYSFITLTTIGFGDYVPTFQDGQARTFGTYFTVYQIFIVFWNFIGVGYFIMIIGFIAKGMHSKRVAGLEHQLSMNIKETQHRIWTEVTKDVNFLRRILNEANMMKFKPVYTDPTENEIFRSLHRSSSCPDILMHRSLDISRKRAYSENCGTDHHSSTITLQRCQSEGDISRIDKKKTFEGSGSLFQKKDLLSNVLSALGSVGRINEDEQSSMELDLFNEQYPMDSSYEWKNSIASSLSSELGSSFETVTIQDDSDMQTKTLNRSFMSKINPFKDRSLSRESRKNSMTSQNTDVQKYFESTSKGRGSRNSFSHLTMENIELLQNTSIADLIRAVEGTQKKTNISPETPLLGEYKEKSNIKITPTVMPTKDLRRGSLRPVHDYTTVFTSKNINFNKESAVISRPFSVNPPSMMPPKRVTKRIRSTSSSIPTVYEDFSSIPSLPMLYRTMSLRPVPISRNTEAPAQMPMITVQAPNESKRNLLWRPEYQQESTFQK